MAIFTLDELKDFCKITRTDNDALLEAARLAGESDVKRVCGRSFEQVQTATTRKFEVRDAYEAYVDDFWTTTDLVVATDDDDDGTAEVTWASGDYQLYPLNGRVGGIDMPYYCIKAVEARWFPIHGRRPALHVTAKWGWAEIPDAVRLAGCIFAASREKVRDLVRGEGGFTRWSREDATEMLQPYVHSSHIGIA